MPVLRKIRPVFRDLGRISYSQAMAVQQRLHAQVVEGSHDPTVLLLEHDPVITVTKRDGIAAHLLASPELLRGQGIEVVETDRGGDITYHGPGQLVAYPIVPLQPLGLNVRQYVAALEQAIIDTLAKFGVEGRRDPAGVGVWVSQLRSPGCSQFHTPHPAKIAAIGVRVRRWVTLHGLALNVTTNLDHFRHIVPCGLPQPVTNLQQLLADRCPPMEAIKSTLVQTIEQRLFGL